MKKIKQKSETSSWIERCSRCKKKARAIFHMKFYCQDHHPDKYKVCFFCKENYQTSTGTRVSCYKCSFKRKEKLKQNKRMKKMLKESETERILRDKETLERNKLIKPLKDLMIQTSGNFA